MSSGSKLKHWVITAIASIALTIGTNLVLDMTHAPSDNRVQDYQIQTLNQNFSELNKNMSELINKVDGDHDETIRAQGRDQVLDARINTLDENLGFLEKRMDSAEGRLDRLEGGKSSS